MATKIYNSYEVGIIAVIVPLFCVTVNRLLIYSSIVAKILSPCIMSIYKHEQVAISYRSHKCCYSCLLAVTEIRIDLIHNYHDDLIWSGRFTII